LPFEVRLRLRRSHDDFERLQCLFGPAVGRARHVGRGRGLLSWAGQGVRDDEGSIAPSFWLRFS